MAIERNLLRAGIISGGFWGVFTGFFSYLILSLNRTQVTAFLISSGNPKNPIAFQTFAFALVVVLITLGICGGIVFSVIFDKSAILFGKLSPNKRGLILGIVFGLVFILIYPFPGEISDIGYILISAASGYFLSSFYARFTRNVPIPKKV